MILAQLRREFAVRSLRWWVPVAAMMGLWWAAMMKFGVPAVLGPVPLRGLPEGVIAATCMLWTATQIYLLNAGYASRCSSAIDIALPLSARRSWLTHVAAISLSWLCIPLILAAFFVAGNALGGREVLLDPGVLSLLLHATVSMLLALAVLQSPRPALSLLPNRRAYVTLTVLTVCGSLILIFLLNALPRVWALLPLGIALALGLRTYARIPRAFTVVPREPYPVRYTDRMADRANHAGAGRMLWLRASTIWRSPFGNWTWLYLVGFALYGVILGLLVEMEGWHTQAPMLMFWSWLMLCAWIMVAHSKLFTLDPLPLSRRWIYAVFIVPAMSCLLLGYCGVTAVVRLAGVPGNQVEFRDVGDHHCVTVPNDAWAIAWTGVLPEYETPEGESVRPCCGQALAPGLRARAFNPFHTPRGASPELVAWQISRAVEAVYGHTIPPAEIHKRYLTQRDDGRIVLLRGRLTLREDYPELRRRGAGAALPLVFALIGVAWFGFAGFVHRVYRGRISKNWAGHIVTVTFLLAMVAGVGLLVAAGVGFVDLRGAARFAGPSIRQLYATLPGGGFTVAGASLLLFAGAYLAAQRQFLRVEAPIGTMTGKPS